MTNEINILKDAFILGIHYDRIWYEKDKFVEDLLKFYKSHGENLTKEKLFEKASHRCPFNKQEIVKEGKRNKALLFFNAGFLLSFLCHSFDCGGGEVMARVINEKIPFYEEYFSMFGEKIKDGESYFIFFTDYFPMYEEKDIENCFNHILKCTSLDLI